MSFLEKLSAAQAKCDSWLCIGIDPNPTLLPNGVELSTFCHDIVDATQDYACAFKFNLAFFLSHGPDGFRTLIDLVAAVPDEIPVVLDAKFGDIGYTAEHYGRTAFDVVGADAVTVSPYVGIEAITPLLEYRDRMVLVLVRSANREGNDFQIWPSSDAPLFRYVTAEVNTLAQKHPGQIGITAAATLPRDLARIRCWTPTLPLLISGVGTQEGNLRAAVEHGPTRDGVGPMISTARAIIYSSQDAQYAEHARASAAQWVEDIRRERTVLAV